MKNIFKKIAVIALVMIMCVSSIVPSISATETICPGENNSHRADNCTYTVVAKTEVSCEADGIVTGQCNSCGTKFVADKTDALGHDWDVAAATCTAPITKTCKVCGEVKKTTGSADHVWTEWTVTGGVCKIGERRSRTCTVCGTLDPASGAMLEAHSWVVDSYVEPKLCDEPAIAYYVCENSGCDAKKTAELWLAGENATHATFVEWDVRQAAILGLTVDFTDSDQVKALKSNPKYVKDPNYVEKTCAADGYKSVVCPTCDYAKVVNVGKETHAITDLRFVDEVLEGGCGTPVGKFAYWQCFDCGARYLAKETSKTTYYAADGTTYPVFEADELPSGTDYSYVSADATYYPLYVKRTYSTTQYGALVEKESDLNVTGDKAARYRLTHEFYSVYKAPSCTADGYYSRQCSWCGLDESGIIPATGHVYYSDNPSASVQKAILKQKVTGFNPDDYTWSNYAPGKEAGKGITWEEGTNVGATCEKNAYVYEICLNVHQTLNCYDNGEGVYTNPAKYTVCHDAAEYKGADGYIKAEHKKEYLLSGEGKEALGHEWDKADGATWTGNPEPTCTSTGVYVITCANGCNTKKNETAPAKGHDFTGTKTTIETATCVKDGTVSVACKNPGCLETQTVVVPKGNDLASHDYTIITVDGEYTTTLPTLKCGKSCVVVFSCSRDNCPAKVNPATCTVKNEDHKYYDTTVAANLNAIKALTNAGEDVAAAKIMDTTDPTVVAVQYMVAGDCTKAATYRLNCLEDCGMFKSFEISEGFNTGAHSIVYASYAAQVANTCTEKDGTNLKEYVIGYWYCSVKTCPLYSTTRGDKTKGTFTTYSSHLNAEGKAITYKDVPDAAISGAASLAEARNVKAPVDENGNTIYSVDIPGTSLVWLYIADVSCSNDGVSLGGFYCVNCKNANFGTVDTEAQVKAQVYQTKETFHTLVATNVVPSTCTSYGYTEKACAKCFYTVQTNFDAIDDHAYTVVETKPAYCERDGYVVEQCTGCKVYKTTITPATGHHNSDNVKIGFSCLDDMSSNRTCKDCKKKVYPVHTYGADNKCTICGEEKDD